MWGDTRGSQGRHIETLLKLGYINATSTYKYNMTYRDNDAPSYILTSKHKKGRQKRYQRTSIYEFATFNYSYRRQVVYIEFGFSAIFNGTM